MNLKTVKSIVILAASSLLLTGCNNEGGGGQGGGNARLKVWCPTEDRAVMNKITADYTALNPGVTFDIGEVPEGEVGTQLQKDPSVAADVFALADDNLKYLVKLDLVASLGQEGGVYWNKIYENNLQWTAEAATVDGKVYGFPQTSDNGYFLWYNASFVSDVQAQTLEGLLEAAKVSGKKVLFNFNDSWVFSSFFFTNGGKISCDAQDKQICDFDNANGQAAMTATQELLKKYKSVIKNEASNSDMATMMQDESCCAAITGTWMLEKFSILGNKLKASKLPTMKIGGIDKQMGSFRSAKIVSVKSNSQYFQEAVKFADFATNEKNQLYRFQQRSVGPSNKIAYEVPEVKANFMQKAVREQDAFGIDQQKNISGARKYWDAVGQCGKDVFQNPVNPWMAQGGKVDKYLKAMVAQMN